MKKKGRIFLAFALVFPFYLAACAQAGPPLPAAAAESDSATNPVETYTENTPATSLTLWVSPGVPDLLAKELILPVGLRFVGVESKSDFQLVAIPGKADSTASGTTWIYVLASPFATVTDDVRQTDLMNAWRGNAAGDFEAKPLLLSQSTLEVFTRVWGAPAVGAVKVLEAENLLVEAEKDPPAWAILPFEELQPRWKVLSVDGISPLDKTMDLHKYPLAIEFGLRGSGGATDSTRVAGLELPQSNWNPDHLTTLLMTGTTALVRTTALRMEEKGIDYPATDILDWFKSADLVHVSNEAPFYSECPPAKPLREEARFCSDPGYIGLLKTIGANLIELTGNHLLDWGADAFLETLALYQKDGYHTYGGGANIEEAQKPLEVEDHGNRLVFIGCNAVGPQSDLATGDHPGAAPCDFEKIKKWIEEYLAKGYLPVVTFQHFELDDFKPQSTQRTDSKNVSAAGAVIVSGSQAHHAQCTFLNGERFIHYGLGNLFFDQMMKENRPAFIDRHVFYEGRYISAQLLTTLLEDGAKPRPMTTGEREKFLTRFFDACKQDAAYVP